jgi:hypothetical protein
MSDSFCGSKFEIKFSVHVDPTIKNSPKFINTVTFSNCESQQSNKIVMQAQLEYPNEQFLNRRSLWILVVKSIIKAFDIKSDELYSQQLKSVKEK